AFFLVVLGADKPVEAGIVQSHPVRSLVDREAVRIITPEVIRRRSLTLRWDLQDSISNLCRKNRSGLVSVTVLNPHTGEILAMYGRDSSGENCTLALNPYLAASLFKVVTAAAAIDYAGLSTSSTFSFTGSAHTLYKSQITEKKNRWTTEVTLAKAFATSNNVILGKIGAMTLGETPLLLTATRFGFWKPPVVDLECTPSTVFIPETEFNLAELASGYNRYTRVSSVHAAQMVSAVVNDGSMIRPKILRTSDTGLEKIMCRETADELRAMMCQTVRNGTFARAFSGAQKDPVLKGLTIGAKSGTINGVDPEGRRCWFMGFAQDSGTGEAITIGCLVIRDDRTQVETSELARRIIRSYFARPALVAAKG
ncbi:MAG TPA: penicillin-binding transpeptidase domain-containing protein, partial [Deltaproteobacteria bacterium]|nr:penicillin-binding transpeptidase domain-containing protein [Deltaproteobacteria bacterium]